MTRARLLTGIVALGVLTSASLVAQSLRAIDVSMSEAASFPGIDRARLPAYPGDSSFDGLVNVETAVDANGRMVHTRVVPLANSASTPAVRTAHESLGRTCVEAMTSWQFKPPRDSDGRPFATFFVTRFEFRPPSSAAPSGTVSARVLELSQEPAPAWESLAGVDVRRMTESGVTWAKPLRQIKPRYTPDGMRAKIQGDVDMLIAILADGTVGAARVTKSLETSLDRAALIAARHWLFEPARFNGQPVAVQAELTLSFRLH